MIEDVTMPETMWAVRCHGPEDYRLERLPVPVPGPGEVVIRVEACGVCASDVKCFIGAPLFWGDAHRLAYVEPPVPPGHEFVGRVAALGAGAEAAHALAVGDRVISEQIVPCRQCRQC
ncbi:MAG: alcohol dehydrogenase catalytic domain-containing protein, partial [Rubrivivax sp.]|nr:alcohol dehydrogenase catalytic domain-containing protein [Rubrivivax sp.]